MKAQKTMAIAHFAGAPRIPKASQNGAFEAFGGQVGQEHVIAAHLDGEGKAFSAPSEAKRVPKEHQFGRLFGAFFWITFGVHFRRLSNTKWSPECDPKWSTCGDG